MDELIGEVESVFRMISGLMVSGDNVDIVAASRSKLRKIHAELTKIVAETDCNTKEEE